MAAAMAAMAAASVSTGWWHSAVGRSERGIITEKDDFREGFSAGRKTRYAFSGDAVSGSLKQRSIKALEGTSSSDGGKKSALKNGSTSALLTEMAKETLVCGCQIFGFDETLEPKLTILERSVFLSFMRLVMIMTQIFFFNAAAWIFPGISSG